MGLAVGLGVAVDLSIGVGPGRWVLVVVGLGSEPPIGVCVGMAVRVWLRPGVAVFVSPKTRTAVGVGAGEEHLVTARATPTMRASMTRPPNDNRAS